MIRGKQRKEGGSERRAAHAGAEGKGGAGGEEGGGAARRVRREARAALEERREGQVTKEVNNPGGPRDPSAMTPSRAHICIVPPVWLLINHGGRRRRQSEWRAEREGSFQTRVRCERHSESAPSQLTRKRAH